MQAIFVGSGVAVWWLSRFNGMSLMGTPQLFLISKQTTWGECETYFSFPSQSAVTLLGDTGALQRRWAGDFTSGREYFFLFFLWSLSLTCLNKGTKMTSLLWLDGWRLHYLYGGGEKRSFCHERRRFPLMPCSNDKNVLVQSEIWNDFLFFAPVHAHNKSQWRWLHWYALS